MLLIQYSATTSSAMSFKTFDYSPWSIDWRTCVWWKKDMLAWVTFSVYGWLGHFLTKSIILIWAWTLESSFLHTPRIDLDSSSFFFCFLYWQGRCLMFLKNRGCLNLPTRYICKFSPIALAATLPVFSLQNIFHQINDLS